MLRSGVNPLLQRLALWSLRSCREGRKPVVTVTENPVPIIEALTPAASERRRKVPGRPSLPPESRRVRRVEVFFSEAELVEVAKAAEAVGATTPAFIRSAAMGTRIKARVPLSDVRLTGDLKRIGNVLDQLAKAANAGRVVSVLPADLTSLSDRLDAVALAILSGEAVEP